MGLTRGGRLVYKKIEMDEEKVQEPGEKVFEDGKKREIDLNALYPGQEMDLNRLFPDEETRRLLYDLQRSKREIERFIKHLGTEEE